MFHAAAVPVNNSAKPIEADASLIECMSFHCDNIMQDDQKAKQCCPGAVALQPPSQLQVMVSGSNNNHVSFSPSLIRLTPNVLFRPPQTLSIFSRIKHS